MDHNEASQTTYPAQNRLALPGLLIVTFRWFITLALPAFLVLTSVRLVMNEAYLWLEYHRPGFPDDPYGLTREERLEYGPYGVRYLLNDAGIDYLGRLQLDGGPAFRSKELEHMQDVKIVTRAAMQVHTGLTIALFLALLTIGWHRSTRTELWRGLSGGGMFTIGLVVTLVLTIVMAWDVFFDSFHSIFFEGDSWRFYNHDTLIRLYPEQFWFDIAIMIGMLTLAGAAAAIWSANRWGRRHIAPSENDKNGAAADPVSNPVVKNSTG